MAAVRRLFLGAGILGLLSLVPLYFLERRLGIEQPPALTHPEYFYGFLGVAVAWQAAFLVIARDPVRFRPLMPVAVLEKAAFGLGCLALLAAGRLPLPLAVPAAADLLLGAAFAWAWVRTGRGELN